MSTPNPNKLLVEGKGDQYAIAELMAHHVAWGNSHATWPVEIKELDGIENLLEPGAIGTEWKQSDLRRMGIVVDANSDLDSRWASLKAQCSVCVPATLPDRIPEAGLVLSSEDGRKLGVWIMPDNQSRGMLETFLALLVPDQDDCLWGYAKHAVGEAMNKGAGLAKKDIHKGNIHTWLAWQNDPGVPLGLALKKKYLDPHSGHATPFVEWFRRLFDL